MTTDVGSDPTVCLPGVQQNLKLLGNALRIAHCIII